MTVRTALSLSIASLLCAVSAHAQTHPGLTFDETVHSGRALNTPNDSSVTSVMHFTTSRGNVRIDVVGPMPEAGSLPTGNGRSVMLLTDSGATITFINVDQKQYMTINPVGMMEGVKKMMEAMGGKIVIDTAATNLALDSLGAGPVVTGHPTLHYRLTTSLRMTLAMMGNSQTMELQSVDDIYAATDFGELSDLNVSMNRLANIGQTVGLAPDFMERAKALQKKIHGLPIRLTKVQTVKTDGRTRTMSEDIVVSNIKHVDVPDSAFAIPDGYTPVAMTKVPAVDQ
jgi:hypothetical protein